MARRSGLSALGGSVQPLDKWLQRLVCALSHAAFQFPETIRIIGGELMMMDDIIEKADFIAVHTPLTEKTRE